MLYPFELRPRKSRYSHFNLHNRTVEKQDKPESVCFSARADLYCSFSFTIARAGTPRPVNFQYQ